MILWFSPSIHVLALYLIFTVRVLHIHICTSPRWGVPPLNLKVRSVGFMHWPEIAADVTKSRRPYASESQMLYPRLVLVPKALNWISASSSLHLGPEGRMRSISDSSCSPLSLRVFTTGTNMLWRLHQLINGTPRSLSLLTSASLAVQRSASVHETVQNAALSPC